MQKLQRLFVHCSLFPLKLSKGEKVTGHANVVKITVSTLIHILTIYQ